MDLKTDPEIHISSIVVHTHPDHRAAVVEQIIALDCEIAPTDGDENRLVVIVERHSDREVADTLDSLHAIRGVLSALLVYHHAEPASALEELVQ